MITLRHEVLIYRPIEDVVAVAGDPAKDPQWMAAVMASEPLSDGPLAVGARYRQVGKFLGRSAETVYEVTEFEPGRWLCLASVDSPLLVRDRREFRGQGRDTRVVRTIDAEVGAFFRISEALVGMAARRQVETDLEVLKIFLDARADVEA
jgi:hypothetical protein